MKKLDVHSGIELIKQLYVWVFALYKKRGFRLILQSLTIV